MKFVEEEFEIKQVLHLSEIHQVLSDLTLLVIVSLLKIYKSVFLFLLLLCLT